MWKIWDVQVQCDWVSPLLLSLNPDPPALPKIVTLSVWEEGLMTQFPSGVWRGEGAFPHLTPASGGVQTWDRRVCSSDSHWRKLRLGPLLVLWRGCQQGHLRCSLNHPSEWGCWQSRARPRRSARRSAGRLTTGGLWLVNHKRGPKSKHWEAPGERS